MSLENTQLICESQPFCLCVGKVSDWDECCCTGGVVGCQEDLCKACGTPLVQVNIETGEKIAA